MSVSISNSIRIILNDPRPIILIDTCSFLDVIRSPFRREFEHHVKSAKQLLDDATRKKLWIVTTDTVFSEYKKNISSVLDELEKHIEKIESDSLEVNKILNILGMPKPADSIIFDNVNVRLNLQKITNLMFDSSHIVEADAGCRDRAGTREGADFAPARKGSQFRDCLIIETMLELCNGLRLGNFLNEIVFITNNSNDYGHAPVPFEPLLSEFNSRNIKYVNRFNWARSELFPR